MAKVETVGVPETVTGMLNVPVLAFTVSLPVPNCTLAGSVMVSVFDRLSAHDGAGRGRIQGQCQRLVWGQGRRGACR